MASSLKRKAWRVCSIAIALLPWLKVTPDLQYVFDPGGVDGTRDAVVCVLRFRVTW